MAFPLRTLVVDRKRDHEDLLGADIHRANNLIAAIRQTPREVTTFSDLDRAYPELEGMVRLLGNIYHAASREAGAIAAYEKVEEMLAKEEAPR